MANKSKLGGPGPQGEPSGAAVASIMMASLQLGPVPASDSPTGGSSLVAGLGPGQEGVPLPQELTLTTGSLFRALASASMVRQLHMVLP